MTDLPGSPLPDHTRTHAHGGGAAGSVGPYRLLERVGEGGMGEVWLAEQVYPVRRQVAVKIIKAGLDTAQVVARFEAERQALALMDHPAIAKVFDAGSTEYGRPYFAMEYVRGDALTTYCDRHRLTIRDRLGLFVQLCEGVQHAHQKGIIHRDLKPSNVLVTTQDDHPVPKIIDFGVAKATSFPLTEHTLYTSLGGFVGTPEYMSPEQAEGGVDIDTRTDIYSLGVILYELLTGMLPFDRAVFTGSGIDQIRRTIREVDPPKPSTRLTRAGGAADAAGSRNTEPARLAGTLRGDLDWITMKALAKERTRRYGSASELAGDIRRHLERLPVLAGPPSAIYRTKKFVSRHRLGVAVGVMIAVFLMTSATLMAVQSRRIARERDRANAEAHRANQEAAAARQVAAFLVDLFKVSDPSESRGATLTARELLDKGARDLDKTLAEQPEVQARLKATIGNVYTSLGLYQDAVTHLESALATQRRVIGETHDETLRTMHHLANAYWYQGRLHEAERLYRDVAEQRTRLQGPEHPDTLRANFDLASTFAVQRRWSEAEALALETLRIQRRVLGSSHPDSLSSLNNLQAIYFLQRRYADALPVAEEVLRVRRETLGAEHPGTLLAAHNVATVYEKLDRNDAAERMFLDNLESKRRVLGAAHPDTALTEFALALLYSKQRRFSEAEATALAAYERLRTRLGDQHPDTRRAAVQIGGIHEAWGKRDVAARWPTKK
jgi:serine/threonine protein kinase